MKGLPASCLLKTGGQQNIIGVLKENNMKTKRTHRHTGANWQGKGTGSGYSATLGQEKTRSVHSSHAHVKPFSGKVFYLDLPSNRITESLESDIKELGGTVEKFFSKEIKYLVTNKREARYVLCLRQDSPVPSPDSGPSSPHPCSNPHQPGSHMDKVKNTFRDHTDTLATSRGKSLVDRVVKERERIQVNKILSNALDWGVKILYIDDILAYLEKKKKAVCSQCPPAAAAAVVKTVKAEPVAKQRFQKCKAGRISKPFVKVEDSSKHYRPIYLTMPSMPQFNLKNVPPFSPFLAEEKCPTGNKQPGHRGVKASASEEKHERKKNRDKRRGGYCECCMIKYGNATMHLQSKCHKAFSKSDKYLVLDRLISTMHCNFSNILNQVKRPKHSISSVLVAPGPCVNTEVRHEADDPIEMIKGQHRTPNVHKDFCSGPALKKGTFPASAALIHREEGRRSDDICSDSFKDKSLGSNRVCRQDSLTSYAQRASGPKNETASCGGEFVDSFVSKVADSVDQASEYSNNSTSHRENDTSSKFLHAATSQQAMSDVKQCPSAFESVRDQSTLDDKIDENNLPEREEGSPTTQSYSPVPKIKRRIRVYKRRRLKVDTHFDPDNSRLKLWEMFQSSEDMDVEFLGFDDSEEGNN